MIKEQIIAPDKSTAFLKLRVILRCSLICRNFLRYLGRNK